MVLWRPVCKIAIHYRWPSDSCTMSFPLTSAPTRNFDASSTEVKFGTLKTSLSSTRCVPLFSSVHPKVTNTCCKKVSYLYYWYKNEIMIRKRSQLSDGSDRSLPPKFAGKAGTYNNGNYIMGLTSNGWYPALTPYIKLGWKWQILANTSILQYRTNYCCKRIYSTGRWGGLKLILC